MDPMAAIRDIFFQECEEQLAELETGLMAIESRDHGLDTLNAVFRAVHSIKGGAGAFGLDALVRFAHVFETALDAMRAGARAADAPALKVMLRGADTLADLVRAAREGTAADDSAVQTMATELALLCAAEGDPPLPATDDKPADGPDPFGFQPVAARFDLPQPGPPTLSWTIQFAPRPELYANGNDPALLLRELARLGEMRAVLDETGLPDLARLDVDGAYLAWTITLAGDATEPQIRDVFDFVEDDCALVIARAEPGSPIPTPAQTLTPLPQACSDALPEQDPARAALLRALNDAAEPPAAPPSAVVPPAAPRPNPQAPGPPAPDPPAAKADLAGHTIRVDLGRVDRLIDLVGELVINEAMLSQRVHEAGVARATGVAMALDDLGQLTRDIQDSVMAIRAQPVRSVFQRMPRLVREVAALTGKSVRLVTDGEGTEVDKTVIERLSDPLTHMIRNAIDHGLELPAVRAEAGKPEEGTVRLSALHRSGRIVIEVADDGAGIDRARVRGKAIQNGVIAADAPLTDDEIDNLIFMPGFSTADAVSNISGRGVGMDVVRRSVQGLGGRISIASRPGLGSTFTLSLPLTLAVLDGMVVRVAGHTLIVPIGAVIETLQPRPADLHGLGLGVRLIALRGGFIPMLDVGVALGYRTSPHHDDRSVALLVEGESGQRAVLLVDGIQGQRQVVIKSLEANYQAVRGIAAATVMGDGRVALILDVDALLAELRTEPVRQRQDLETAG